MSLVSVIGAGSLANVFANVLHEFLPEFKLHSVLGRSQEKAEVFASKYSCQAVFNIDDFLKEAAPVVVELAGGAALKDYALPILKSGRTLICLSSGAFADEDFKQQAILTASENNGRICIVNGAIGGLDFLQTCALQRGSAEVIIETTKSPKSLLGAPGLDGRTLDLTKRTVVFEGGVQEAIKGFPKNINVGVIASLASQKPQTKVRIVADPAANSNTHQITYRSALADAVMEFSGKSEVQYDSGAQRSSLPKEPLQPHYLLVTTVKKTEAVSLDASVSKLTFSGPYLASRLLASFQEIHCRIKNLGTGEVRQTLPNLRPVSLG